MVEIINWEGLLRVFLSLALGYLIGLQRELSGHPAGVRTHALVALGATLFTVASLDAFDKTGVARVASTIVTGLGFLGAGTIIKEEREIHGLTTAAGIWALGAMGLAIGLGEYVYGVVGGVLIWLVLFSERLLRRHRENKSKHDHFQK